MRLLLGAGLCLAAVSMVDAQVCRLSVAGLNRARRVTGPISAECPGPLIVHTAPFGNWGVSSNFGPALNGHQFQGWCHDTRVCDNNNDCRTNCSDGWYEWNSCTAEQRYKAPNCTLYNAENCTSQESPMGENVLGTRVVDIPVRCPFDTDGDGVPDQGGCRDVTTYSHGTNFMTLYELDPAGPNELIQTLYFPPTPVALQCNLLSCPPAGSEWVRPASYDSPASPAKVYAEMAMVVNSATFIDSGNACLASWPRATCVSGASFTAPVAPESIVSAFGPQLARAAGVALQLPLPAQIEGTSVRVRDSRSVERQAGLFFVSPGQVNYLMPPGTAPGAATVIVQSGAGMIAIGSVQVEAVAPALFTAAANGMGVAAAAAVRVSAEGVQTPVEVFRCAEGACAAVPVDLGAPSDRVYVSFYGTGIRGGGASPAVTIGGVPCEVTYAGQQGFFSGLDQVNVLLPRSLAGRGTAGVELTVAGRPANPVSIAVR